MKYQEAIEKDIQEDMEALNKKLAKWHEVKDDYEDFLNALPEDDMPSIHIYGGGLLDLYAYGDGDLLTRIVRALRTTGWETKTERPKANYEAWVAHFSHQYTDRKIYLNFSSTVCRKVKVGTVMKEVDVFEVRCGPEEVIDDANQSV